MPQTASHLARLRLPPAHAAFVRACGWRAICPRPSCLPQAFIFLDPPRPGVLAPKPSHLSHLSCLTCQTRHIRWQNLFLREYLRDWSSHVADSKQSDLVNQAKPHQLTPLLATARLLCCPVPWLPALPALAMHSPDSRPRLSSLHVTGQAAPHTPGGSHSRLSIESRPSRQRRTSRSRRTGCSSSSRLPLLACLLVIPACSAARRPPASLVLCSSAPCRSREAHPCCRLVAPDKRVCARQKS